LSISLFATWELPEPVTVDPGTLSKAERKAKGILQLPNNLGDAIAQLEQDEVLLEALRAEFATAYLIAPSNSAFASLDLSRNQTSAKINC
jgi:glutamine synthetase